MREELISVGIDIGTSTTQLIFSKLMIENMASNYTVPKIAIVEKKIIYQSDIYFTPLLSPVLIDGNEIRTILETEYKKAGIEKEQIDTGAIIITGETARKENAKEVLASLSGLAGDFVVATAGPDLESIISAKGAGAPNYSKKNRACVIHFDIGGGTSNFALFQQGEVIQTGCFDIGGRLIKIDKETKKITYLSKKMEILIKKHHLPIEIGSVASKDLLKPLLNLMIKVLMECVGLEPMDDDLNLLITNQETQPNRLIDKPIAEKIDAISFSGGVADFIYGKPSKDLFLYGDIGILLGEAIRESKLLKEIPLIKGEETIRATVVGAGAHTTEISGSTITYTTDAFPMKNLPILKLTREEEKTAETMETAIQKKLEWFHLDDDMQQVAIALEGIDNPSFAAIKEYAAGIVAGTVMLCQRNLPLVVIVEKDMAKVLGQTIYHLLSYQKDVICLDSISLDNGDYIDIGKPAAKGNVLPVVVKTLIFNK